MTEIKEAFLDELDTWECNGVNVGQAIRKQFVPVHLPEVEVDDGEDRDGKRKTPMSDIANAGTAFGTSKQSNGCLNGN